MTTKQIAYFGSRPIMETLALYIHIPYCLEKCPYCDFHSIAVNQNEIPAQKYADCLARQFEREVQRFELHSKKLISIYFGGGTPSLMPASFFEKILKGIEFYLGSLKNVEVTVETNPKTASLSHFKEWLLLGINRLSFGCQSFQDPLLAKLGRNHCVKEGIQCVHEAFEAGFKNLSCDLIFGMEGETLQNLEKDLEILLALKVPHTSIYQLTVEPNTPLSSFVAQGSFHLLDEGTLVSMHRLVSENMQSAGFVRYEISNYAKSGFESRHNLQYWHYQEYLGIGSGAVSFVDGKRWRTTRKLKNYLANVDIEEDLEILSSKTKQKERWMMGLRLKEGVRLSKGEERWLPEILKWQEEGFLCFENGHVFLTEKGFLVSNRITQNVFALIEEVC